MLFVKCQENSSCRETYAPKWLYMIVVIGLLLICGCTCLQASKSGPRLVSDSESGLVVANQWLFGLAPAAGSGGSVSVTMLSGAGQACPLAEVVASLDAGGKALSIELIGCANPPVSATGDMAQIEVFDAGSNLLYRYTMRLGGGEVIVVLMDD